MTACKRKEKGVRKMHRKIVFAVLAILTLLSLVYVPNVPTKAWVYPDCTEDDKFELFGPRLDRLLIKLYPDLIAESSALEAGEIDIMDWKAPWWYYDKWTTPPYNELIKLVDVLCNLDEIALKINNNKTVYGEPNPCHVSSFRHALAHMVDRNQIIMVDCGGWAIPMYTEVPRACCLEKYSHPDIWPGELLQDLTHPYDQAEAERLLREDGFFRIPEPTGPWYWIPAMVDPKQWPEYTVPIKVHLTFVIPSEDPIKMNIGYRLELKLNEMGIQHTSIFLPNMGIHYEVMLEKHFHLYLADQNLRKDPDYLYDMKHSQMYWHPGACPNYIHFNDPEYDMWAERLKCAATEEEAVAAARKCQEIYATPCRIGSVPICMLVGNKAMKRCYTGTLGVVDEEDMYECQSWKGIVNGYWDKGSCGADYGINSWWTFLNAYPEGHLMGDCQYMTMRYGFMTPELKWLNPIYAYEFWDWEVMNKVYDTLIKNDPYHKWHPDLPQEIPWLAKNWTIGNWTHPRDGYTGTKLTFSLRTSVTWHDGIPFCSEDVKFTLVDLPQFLEKHGFPKPRWHMKVKQILYVHTPDPCNVEVYFTNESMWGLHWIGELKILPKHIWKPILEGVVETFWSMGDVNRDGYINQTDIERIQNAFGSKPGDANWNPYADLNKDLIVNNTDLTICTGNQGLGIWTYYYPMSFMPDPSLIGCGPWKFVDYVPHDSVLLEKNKEYFHWCPVDVNIKVSLPKETEWKQKVPGWPTPQQWDAFWSMGDVNRDGYINQTDVDLIMAAWGSYPGHPKWDPRCDLNKDNIVNLHDSQICAKNQGLIIWEEFYTSEPVYFDIGLHNLWANQCSGSELIVNKWVKLIVPDPKELPMGVLPQATFQPGQWLHFQETTKLRLYLNTTIHYLTEGPVIVNGTEEYHLPCDTVYYPPSTNITFFECMEIELVERAIIDFYHSTQIGIAEEHDLPLRYCEEHWEAIPIRFKKCHWKIKVFVHIKGPEYVYDLVPNPWVCQWINRTFDFWATIPEDIVGAYFDPWHPPNGQLRVPDCKLDMKDIGTAARTFVSYPGDPRWDPLVDINADFKNDMKDIGIIARKFGWKC